MNYHEEGVICIEINKTGKAVGFSDIDADMLKFKDRLKNNIMPSCMGLFDVSVAGINSKKRNQDYYSKLNRKAVRCQETLDVSAKGISICIETIAKLVQVSQLY